jgi:sigma-E factor negative regulatory protein RseA
MKEEISALMDGELFEDEADYLLDKIKRDSESHQDWAVYHLIGDVLRQPDYIHCDLSEKINQRLQNEPIVLSPRRRTAKQKVRSVALSAAASLVAVAAVAWMSLQINPVDTSAQIAMQQQPTLRPASAQMHSKSRDYLMAHQEFSPGVEMNGGASYIRNASYSTEEK